MRFLLNVNQVFITRVALYALAFLLSVVIARGLGPDGRGVYSLFFLVVSIAAAIAGFGVGLGNVYFLGKGQYTLRVLLGNCHALVIAITAMAFVLTVAFAMASGADLFVEGRSYWLYVPATAVLLYFTLITSFLQAEGRFAAWNGVWLARHFLVVAAAAAFLLADRLTTFSLLASWTVGLTAANLLALFLVGLPNVSFGAVVNPHWAALKDQVVFGVKGQAGELIQLLNLRLDIFLIAAFVDTENVGYYAVAVGMTETIWWISHAVSTVLLPRLIRDAPEQAAEFTTVVSRNVIVLSAAAAAALALVASFAVPLLFGDDFSPSVNAIYWLLPGVVAIGGQNILVNYFVSQGRAILSSYSAGIALIGTVLLDLILIPPFGIEGAAAASSIAYIAALSASLYWYKNRFGNDAWAALLPRASDFSLYRNAVQELRSHYALMRRT